MLLLLLSRFSRVRLCDPRDGSPLGSPVPGILQARTLEGVAISFSNAWKWKWSCSVMSWPHVELSQILKDDAVKVLHSICQQIWITQQWPQDWQRLVFISVPKKGNAKECTNHQTMLHISHASQLMLKTLQARLQQYVSWEIPDAQAGFRKSRGTRDRIANICWSTEKSKGIPEKCLLLSIDYTKAFDCVAHTTCGKLIKR